MKIINSISSLSKAKDLSLVPTMGNLHPGHLSLVEASLINHARTLVSIFVNPKQFSPGEDFASYPRTLRDDQLLLEKLAAKYPKKELLLYVPDAKEIYPDDFDVQITIPKKGSILEGEFRPTHFQGVATVVMRLFALIKPHTAYFGKKDYQQYLIIKNLVKDFNLNINIVGCETVREESGLAMSSRNNYLSAQQRREALVLSQTLFMLKEKLQTEPFQNVLKLIDSILEKDQNWNYLTIRNKHTLCEINPQQLQQAIILGVYQIASTRLLDNIEYQYD